MKNKTGIIMGIGIVVSALLLTAATVITKISEFPQVTTPGTNDLFLLASGATNKNVKYSDLKTAISRGVLPNSLNTNELGTNLVYLPLFKRLQLNGNSLLISDPAGNVSIILGTTNQPFDGAILTADANGNARWKPNVRLPHTLLTISGTNVSSVDLSSATYFKLTLTTNAFMPAPTGMPGTNQAQSIQITVQQDATGGHVLTWDAAWKFAGGTAPTMTTTTNAVDIYSFVSSAFNASQLYGVPAQDIK